MVAGKKAVQVQEMVAAAVVVAAAAFAVPFVPNALDLREGLWLALVHPVDQVGIHLFAKAHPVWFNLQRLIEKVVLAGDDVDKVADAFGRVVCAVEVYMDTRAAVCEAASLAQLADELLQGVDILAVGKDRADQFHAVLLAYGNQPPVFFLLAGDAGVAHEFPNPTVRCGDLLCVVKIVCGADRAAEELRSDICRLRSGDPREFNLDAEFVAKHACLPLSECVCFSHVH